MELIHGGDWAAYLRQYGRMAVDFSANISPLGMPEGVRTAAMQALQMADCYPDPRCWKLREALAKHLQVDMEWIVCGNGAADLIFRLMLVLRPEKILLLAPCFAEYEQAAHLCDSQLLYYALSEERDFRITSNILQWITPQVSALVLCEPNNPTGICTERALLLRIMEKCAQCGTILIVDECFIDFLADPQSHSLQAWLKTCPNLIILRSFTKLYAMAGLRLGYCLSANQALLGRIQRCDQPWPVSTVAQAAGTAALRERDYVQQLRALIAEERPFLQESLSRLGCRVWPGQANYLLFRSPIPELGALMQQRGFLLRSCANYRGLTPADYRIAVRSHTDNVRLIRSMGEIL